MADKPFLGPHQRTHSRLDSSMVWAKATRPHAATYHLPPSPGGPKFSVPKTNHDASFGSFIPKSSPIVGPGSYETATPGFGKQTLSHKLSTQGKSLGSSIREDAVATYSIFTYSPK